MTYTQFMDAEHFKSQTAKITRALAEAMFIGYTKVQDVEVQHYLLKAIRAQESRHGQVSGLEGYHVPIDQNEAAGNQQNFSPRQNTKAGPK